MGGAGDEDGEGAGWVAGAEVGYTGGVVDVREGFAWIEIRDWRSGGSCRGRGSRGRHLGRTKLPRIPRLSSLMPRRLESGNQDQVRTGQDMEDHQVSWSGVLLFLTREVVET
jgi:hypothetical protein